MHRIVLYLAGCIIACLPTTLRAQQLILATFEDFPEDRITIEAGAYDPALFTATPGVYNNPDTTALNPSKKCLGAINVPNAGWYNNFIELKLKTPVTISTSNRLLTFLAYRSIQPKEMRIGFNEYEETSQVYYDKMPVDARWERIVIDLGSNHMGETLNSVWIVLSCNWYNPREGWGEAAYYFDDFTLSSARLSSASVIIDPSEVYQTIDEFGASDCWTGDVVGKYWGTTQKNFIAEKLFSKEFDSQGNPKGIGLSNWRVNLGAGTSEQGISSDLEDPVRRSECFLKEDGTYDWSKQAGQQYFMERAKEYGCENFLFFSNTPPVYFTKNGKGFANAGETSCNLKSDKFGDFAEFIAIVATHFRDKGYPIKYISPVNEPQYDWTGGQEGSPWQNSDIKKLVTELNNSLQQRNSDIKIMIPEAGSWDKLSGGSGRASNQIYQFFNSQSSNYIGNLPSVEPLAAGHSYWSFSTNATLKDVRTQLWDAAKTYDLKTCQTEWSLLDAAPSAETGFPSSYDAASYMDLALFMGKLMYCDLAFANVSSWSYWTSLATEVYSQKSRFFLLRLTPSDGHGGYNSYASLFNGGKVEDSPNLWVLGNYSLFIRPGYKRIRMDGAAEMNQLLGTAYISPDHSQIVTVYVNTSTSPRYVRAAFKELEGVPVTIRKYTTSSSGNLAKDRSLPEAYTGAMLTIPARSVCTIIYNIDTDVSIGSIPTNQAQQESISVYPSPARANSTVHILMPESNTNPEQVTLQLYSLNGRIVYNQPVSYQNEISFALPQGIEPGIYLIQITLENKKYLQRLIIQ